MTTGLGVNIWRELGAASKSALCVYMRGKLGEERNQIADIHQFEKSVCSGNGSSQQSQPSHIVTGHFGLAAHPWHSKTSKACRTSPTIQLRRQQKTVFSVFNYFVIMACVIISAFVFA